MTPNPQSLTLFSPSFTAILLLPMFACGVSTVAEVGSEIKLTSRYRVVHKESGLSKIVLSTEVLNDGKVDITLPTRN
ncbi:MAG: hypothetical protein ACREB3_11110, partial [Burkholderiales bacterium]